MIDDTIVKEKDILIPSPDWLGAIETDSLPIYLDEEDYLTEDGLSIRPEALKKFGVDSRASRTPVGLYQVWDFGELYTTDFEMTASIRNDFKSGKSLCRAAQVMIMHEDGPISIVLIKDVFPTLRCTRLKGRLTERKPTSPVLAWILLNMWN